MTAEPITISAGPLAPEHTSAAKNAAETCSCGHDASEAIVLDSRTIPHAVRHAAIFGALDAIQPGISLDLIASHNPLPLLATLQRTKPDVFAISYLQDGPEVWTVRLTRTA
jgi:uncharacterized protein (DUF2249 family)